MIRSPLTVALERRLHPADAKGACEQDRNVLIGAVFHIADSKYAQLGDETMQGVNPSSDGRWALGSV